MRGLPVSEVLHERRTWSIQHAPWGALCLCLRSGCGPVPLSSLVCELLPAAMPRPRWGQAACVLTPSLTAACPPHPHPEARALENMKVYVRQTKKKNTMQRKHVFLTIQHFILSLGNNGFESARCPFAADAQVPHP